MGVGDGVLDDISNAILKMTGENDPKCISKMFS